jgi:hypothetical protein
MAAWARFQVHSLDGEGHLERDAQMAAGGYVNLLEIGYPEESWQVVAYFEQNFFGPFHRVAWHGDSSLVPPELREHPNVVRYKQLLGYTPEWRAELCERASHFPPESLIACDPSEYPVHVTASMGEDR